MWGLAVWLAFWLRVRGLFANTFHADEALFATWARHIATWKDPLLLTQAVDKPPLLFYMQALFYPLQGPVEWAARLPNFIASMLLVPLTAVLFHRLYGGKTGALVAALVVACSPLAIQFSATAFTDPLLVFWLVASLSVISVQYSLFSKLAACNRSPMNGHRLSAAAGFLFGLAVATKYQAWLFLPLMGGVGWLGSGGRPPRHFWVYWFVGLLPLLGGVFFWEVARTGAFSLWSAQIGNFGGVRLAWSWELWPRLAAWGGLGGTAVPVFLLPLLLLSMVGLAWRTWRVDDAAGRLDWLLVFFVAAYFVFHWLTAVPVWDRYWLPLVPLVAILLGRGWQQVAAWWPYQILPDEHHGKVATLRAKTCRPYLRLCLFLVLLTILLLPAWPARYGRYPVGGQPAADGGAAHIAAVVQEASYGTVLYDHWFSWQWRYYFFDKGVYVSWFPHGQALATELTVFGRDGNPHYLTLPDTAVSQPIIRAVQAAGFTLQPVANAGNIVLYQIFPIGGSGGKE